MSKHPFKIFFLACAFYVAAVTVMSVPALRDESEAYFNYGQNLITTGIYGVEPGISDDWREPGYGIFLAIVMAPAHALKQLTGSQVDMLRWIVFWQALLFSACLFVFARFSQLPSRLKWIFIAFALLSPTLAGSHGAIYSESLVLNLLVLLLTIFSRGDLFSWRRLVLAAFLASWLLLTKLYLMFYFPMALIILAALSWRRLALRRLLLVPAIPLIFLCAWNIRGRFVEKRQVENARVVLQLAGKVYRYKSWNLHEEWKAALLASCCSSTCDRNYGADVCNKFTFRKSDGMAYELMQDWKQNPENHDKNLLREVLATWWHSLPMQIVSSGLELFRIMFFEAATVSESSSGVWRLFAQLWHIFGSLAVWALALLGVRKAWALAKSDFSTRAAMALGLSFTIYHIVFMIQVTNVQRYSVPLLPWFYLFASFFLF